MTDYNESESADAYPDSPVESVEITHEDGTVKRATGADARAWAAWVDQGVGLAVTRGESPPDIDWDVESPTD